MTTRRFNYTDCIRIHQEDVRVELTRDTEQPVAVAAVDLARYELPPESSIILEAYADWTLMRFSLGRVSAPTGVTDLVLDEFDSPEGIRFRLKVLGTGEQDGLILAEADRIVPVAAEPIREGRSFVIVRPEDLGGVPWKLDLAESGPVLQVDSSFSDWHSVVRSMAFRSLVLPAVLRDMLLKAVDEGVDDEDGSWTNHCFALASHLGFGDPPSPSSDTDEIDEWVDDVVSRFCRSHDLMDQAILALEGGE